jgi:hypothetical protein
MKEFPAQVLNLDFRVLMPCYYRLEVQVLVQLHDQLAFMNEFRLEGFCLMVARPD